MNYPSTLLEKIIHGLSILTLAVAMALFAFGLVDSVFIVLASLLLAISWFIKLERLLGDRMVIAQEAIIEKSGPSWRVTVGNSVVYLDDKRIQTLFNFVQDNVLTSEQDEDITF